ncbi:MAG: hypothetical protein JJE10_08150 [Thermoleophilia bacterium]|nr:hypothetical protein [Thermoleophilia bacterium]
MTGPARPAVPGWLAPVAVGLLVAATVLAFGVSQRLKREPLVVDRVEYRATGSGNDAGPATAFSPNGDCRHDRMVIRFRTTKSDVADVEIVTVDGMPVRSLAGDRFFKRYREHKLVWDGRTELGRIPPTGRYGVRVTMEELDRSFRMPGWIRLHKFASQGSACR